MFLLAEAKRSITQASFLEGPVTYLAFGMTRRCWFDDLKFLPGVYGLSISERYDGASPWSEMKVKISYLYSIRDSTGNQRSDFKTGVMCSYFLVLLTTRTAAFCNL